MEVGLGVFGFVMGEGFVFVGEGGEGGDECLEEGGGDCV